MHIGPRKFAGFFFLRPHNMRNFPATHSIILYCLHNYFFSNSLSCKLRKKSQNVNRKGAVSHPPIRTLASRHVTLNQHLASVAAVVRSMYGVYRGRPPFHVFIMRLSDRFLSPARRERGILVALGFLPAFAVTLFLCANFFKN